MCYVICRFLTGCAVLTLEIWLSIRKGTLEGLNYIFALGHLRRGVRVSFIRHFFKQENQGVKVLARARKEIKINPFLQIACFPFTKKCQYVYQSFIEAIQISLPIKSPKVRGVGTPKNFPNLPLSLPKNVLRGLFSIDGYVVTFIRGKGSSTMQVGQPCVNSFDLCIQFTENC